MICKVPAQEHKQEKVIVYFLTCAAVDFYALAVPIAAGKGGSRTSALHGKMKQSQREATLAAFAEKPKGAQPARQLAEDLHAL